MKRSNIFKKKDEAIFSPVERLKTRRWVGLPLALFLAVCGLAVASCGQIKHLPTETEIKVEYRDSIITKFDTIKVEINKTEYIKDWTGLLDTLELSAEGGKVRSKAWVDTTKSILAGELKTEPRKVDALVPHTLEYHQKDSIKIQQVPYPVETIKEVVKTPRWAWSSLILNFILIALMGLWVYVKFYLKR